MPFLVELGTGLAASLLQDQIKKGAKGASTALEQTLERWASGSLGIFIFGPQGTGKTTALGVLSGAKAINDIPSEYVSSPINEKAKYHGHLYFKAYAGPGQDTLKDIHWPKLYATMQKYRRVLCIFLVSYGCHSVFEEDYAAIQQASQNTREDLIIKDFLSENREQEARQFAEFSKELAAVNGRLGLMLLVTKQDLWWSDRAAVEKHYNRGAFANGIKRLSEAKKAVGFVADTCSVSLSLQNLLSTDKHLLVPTTGGYDQLLQRLNFLSFIRRLDEMVGML